MITIDLLGGLGNQLFQWALGRAFQLIAGQHVQFNPARLESDRGRTFLLDRLGIGVRLTNDRPGQMLYEGSLRYRPDLLKLRGDYSLCGYWQCERYFWEIRHVILDEVFAGMTKSPETLAMAEKIKSYGDRSCMLHVRRSDNLSPRAVMYHGLTCAVGNPYYEKTKELLRHQLENVYEGKRAHFFVFSEDPDWTRANMTEPDMTVVGHNPMSATVDSQGVLTKNLNGRECEDLWLMSLCRHAIMANSTFSWWGTWLNPLEGQNGSALSYGGRIVTTPHPWFATKDADSTDIIPARWTKV